MAADSAIDVIDFANLKGSYADSQEMKWNKTVILNMRGRSNPFHGLIAGIKGKKPIREMMDWKAVDGDTIVLTLDRPLGGEGVQGPSSQQRLVGNEENQYPASYRVKVGLLAHAVAGEQLMKTQTVIGSNWDNRQREKLTEWFKWRMATDIEFEMKVKAHARNTIYPNNKSNLDDLGTDDYLNLDTVVANKSVLNANQAQPFDINRSNSGSEILSYLVMGPSKAFEGLGRSNGYQQLVANAGVRGPQNPNFRGGLVEWQGSYMYDWAVENGTQIGPLAAPCAPVAFLAADLPDSGTDQNPHDILGGGTKNANGQLTKPKFFWYYENAQYTGHEGIKQPADVTTERYLGMRILTGADTGKIAIFAYQVNNGNKITFTKRLGTNVGTAIFGTVGQMVLNGQGSPWTTNAGPNGFKGVALGVVPAGSEIIQINARGTPYVKSYGLGRNALIAGYGNLAPNKQSYSSGGMPGQRIIQTQDYGRVEGLGYQQVWGVNAAEDANNMVNGYTLIYSAWQPPGWPNVQGG